MNAEQYASAYSAGGFQATVRMMLGRGMQPERAEDIAQTAWTRGLENLHQYRGDSAVTTWVARIAINEARDQWRRLDPTIPMPDKFDMPVAVDHDTAIDVETAMRRIGHARTKRVLELRLSGLTFEEIDQAEGIRAGAGKLIVFRGVRQIRERLGVGK